MHNKLPKIIAVSFLLIFAFQLVGLICIISSPQTVQAAPIQFKPQVGIGDDFKTTGTYDVSKKVGDKLQSTLLSKYIVPIYKYAIGIVGILAAVVLMFGGVLWITAGGNNERISSAKSWIAASLSGLVLALCSYMILYTVNPNLVEFKPIETTVVNKTVVGCCKIDENNGKSYVTRSECDRLAKNGWGGEGTLWDSTAKKCAIEVKGCCKKYKVDKISQCVQKDTEADCKAWSPYVVFDARACSEIEGCPNK